MVLEGSLAPATPPRQHKGLLTQSGATELSSPLSVNLYTLVTVSASRLSSVEYR